MEQIKQLLSQLALHLELNIAMCDVLEKHSKSIKELESHYEVLRTRVDGLYTRVSEMQYVSASKAYEARRASLEKK